MHFGISRLIKVNYSIMDKSVADQSNRDGSFVDTFIGSTQRLYLLNQLN